VLFFVEERKSLEYSLFGKNKRPHMRPFDIVQRNYRNIVNAVFEQWQTASNIKFGFSGACC